jgi:hypothetical protein
MTLDSATLVGLSALGSVGFAVLTVLRFRRNGLHRLSARRWLLIDILLLIMSMEVLLDSLIESVGPSDLATAAHLVAVALRGASVAGVLSLLWTFPHSVAEDRTPIYIDRRNGRDRRVIDHSVPNGHAAKPGRERQAADR